ncbi:cell wall hydrolase [Acetobacter orleanensis]|uniref:Cell wall hydrolase SleB domain-containing protein n=1 Tax=Acetobacter orleanensis TaxID=104099 RepID=A0A4Y3TPB5_9PROT|nr:cell wall hydrolase [Acetobacter orleanensis]KXV62587.1 hydrolase [Acetobacter orleanensis]PCD79967.1 cell wall hydrolase [Acetobacter orleanensis]GAN68277.1 cell wall hydrolyse [Acetobacter orleanensis JCM 7639]GBR31159.1 cell wall hydrolyse [Acetobacter orleanensis NRIC 0473]GEB82830.1 hypothetical protein AOR01nite_13070 [Acetobacter orleanensis]
MNKTVDTAARTAWGEARGEGPHGMQAVLNVIGNRAAQPGWWGHDIASVCTAPAQFSCWNKQDPNRTLLLHVAHTNAQFQQAYALASQLCSQTLSDLTGGADHYYDWRGVKPEWVQNKFFTKTIGHHAFYRIGLKG